MRWIPLLLLAACAGTPMAPIHKITVGEIQCYKDDEFTLPDHAPASCDYFLVALKESLMKRGFEMEPSPNSITARLGVYSDLIRGACLVAEVKVWTQGRVTRTLNRNCPLSQGREKAMEVVAADIAEELADRLQTRPR